MTTADILHFFQQQGALVFVAVLILWGGARRTWVWGYQLKEMTQDRDEWKARALRSVGLVERTVTVLEQTTPQVGK